jgi:hypothetical protein
MAIRLCACGLPLHYNSPTTRELVNRFVAELGETIVVTTTSGRYAVQRHYLALHGLKAEELPDLALAGIVRRIETPMEGHR